MKTTVVNIRKGEPANAEVGSLVYIGRANRSYGLAASIWANPFQMRGATRDQVIERYREYILQSPDLLARLPELRGKRLGCWCAPLACHGDVLVELVEALR